MFLLDQDTYWLPVSTAARLSDRSAATVRRWAADGRVATRREQGTGQVTVYLWSVFDVSDETPRRARGRA